MPNFKKTDGKSLPSTAQVKAVVEYRKVRNVKAKAAETQAFIEGAAERRTSKVLPLEREIAAIDAKIDQRKAQIAQIDAQISSIKQGPSSIIARKEIAQLVKEKAKINDGGVFSSGVKNLEADKARIKAKIDHVESKFTKNALKETKKLSKELVKVTKSVKAQGGEKNAPKDYAKLKELERQIAKVSSRDNNFENIDAGRDRLIKIDKQLGKIEAREAKAAAKGVPLKEGRKAKDAKKVEKLVGEAKQIFSVHPTLKTESVGYIKAGTFAWSKDVVASVDNFSQRLATAIPGKAGAITQEIESAKIKGESRQTATSEQVSKGAAFTILDSVAKDLKSLDKEVQTIQKKNKLSVQDQDLAYDSKIKDKVNSLYERIRFVQKVHPDLTQIEGLDLLTKKQVKEQNKAKEKDPTLATGQALVERLQQHADNAGLQIKVLPSENEEKNKQMLKTELASVNDLARSGAADPATVEKVARGLQTLSNKTQEIGANSLELRSLRAEWKAEQSSPQTALMGPVNAVVVNFKNDASGVNGKKSPESLDFPQSIMTSPTGARAINEDIGAAFKGAQARIEAEGITSPEQMHTVYKEEVKAAIVGLGAVSSDPKAEEDRINRVLDKVVGLENPTPALARATEQISTAQNSVNPDVVGRNVSEFARSTMAKSIDNVRSDCPELKTDADMKEELSKVVSSVQAYTQVSNGMFSPYLDPLDKDTTPLENACADKIKVIAGSMKDAPQNAGLSPEQVEAKVAKAFADEMMTTVNKQAEAIDPKDELAVAQKEQLDQMMAIANDVCAEVVDLDANAALKEELNASKVESSKKLEDKLKEPEPKASAAVKEGPEAEKTPKNDAAKADDKKDEKNEKKYMGMDGMKRHMKAIGNVMEMHPDSKDPIADQILEIIKVLLAILLAILELLMQTVVRATAKVLKTIVMAPINGAIGLKNWIQNKNNGVEVINDRNLAKQKALDPNAEKPDVLSAMKGGQVDLGEKGPEARMPASMKEGGELEQAIVIEGIKPALMKAAGNAEGIKPAKMDWTALNQHPALESGSAADMVNVQKAIEKAPNPQDVLNVLANESFENPEAMLKRADELANVDTQAEAHQESARKEAMGVEVMMSVPGTPERSASPIVQASRASKEEEKKAEADAAREIAAALDKEDAMSSIRRMKR